MLVKLMGETILGTGAYQLTHKAADFSKELSYSAL